MALNENHMLIYAMSVSDIQILVTAKGTPYMLTNAYIFSLRIFLLEKCKLYTTKVGVWQGQLATSPTHS